MSAQFVLISIPLDELMSQVRSVVQEELRKGLPEPKPDPTTYSVFQTSKILHRGTRKIKELIQANIIKTTIDGRIPQSEITKYLENKS